MTFLQVLAYVSLALALLEVSLRCYQLIESTHCDANQLEYYSPDAERLALKEARLQLALGELLYVKVFQRQKSRSRNLLGEGRKVIDRPRQQE